MSTIIIIVLAVTLFLFVHFKIKPKNSTSNIEQYVKEYIDNSLEINFNDIERVIDIEFDDIYVGFNLRKLNRSKLSSIPNNQFSFFDNQTNKYYRLFFMNSAESVQIHSIYIKNTIVKAKVNQSQLNNTNYGTRENPIPIFYIEVPKRKKSANYYIVDTTEEQYAEKVYYYLAYIMLKEEFNKRFKSSD